jgi:hypothetical protein
MSKMDLRLSTRKWLSSLVFDLAMLGVAIWLAIQDHEKGFLLQTSIPIAVVLSGTDLVCLLTGLLRFSEVQISISENGITDNSIQMGVGFIPWEEISLCDVVTQETGLRNYILLDVKDPASLRSRVFILRRFAARLGTASTSIVFGDQIIINLSLLENEPDPDQVRKFLVKARSENWTGVLSHQTPQMSSRLPPANSGSG